MKGWNQIKECNPFGLGILIFFVVLRCIVIIIAVLILTIKYMIIVIIPENHETAIFLLLYFSHLLQEGKKLEDVNKQSVYLDIVQLCVE